jgi:hypothetical protein
MSLGLPITIARNDHPWEVTIDARTIAFNAVSEHWLDRQDEVMGWLHETFGDDWGAPDPDVFSGYEWVFAFRTLEDAELFKLRFA